MLCKHYPKMGSTRRKYLRKRLKVMKVKRVQEQINKKFHFISPAMKRNVDGDFFMAKRKLISGLM